MRVGVLMIESGASTSRIEDTIERMGHACDVPSVSVFCAPTCLIVSLATDEETLTRLAAIEHRGIDLGRVAALNDVSRRLEERHLTLDAALEAVEEVPRRVLGYPFLVQLGARGFSCACWAILLGGTRADFLPAMVAGFIVHLTSVGLRKALPEFLAIYFCAFIGTLWAVLAVSFGFGETLGSVVVGVIIPLTPGMALTSSVRDLIAGDLLSGVARGAEALLTAAGIAGGVWSALAMLHGSVFL